MRAVELLQEALCLFRPESGVGIRLRAKEGDRLHAR